MTELSEFNAFEAEERRFAAACGFERPRPHDLRELRRLIADLQESERLRMQDPPAARWVSPAANPVHLPPVEASGIAVN